MVAIHGRRTKVYVNGADLTGYFNQANINRTSDVAETSAFYTDSKTYIPGMLDGTVALEGMYDGTADAVDAKLQALLGTETKPIVLVPIGVEAVGSVAHGIVGDQSTYDVDTASSDVAAVSAEFQSSSSIERCLIHKPLTAITTGNDGDGTAIDNAASSAFGGVGYLQVASVTGGTLTVKVQHSADDVTYADLITFTGTTAVGAQRVAVTGTVNRYTRASDAITASTQSYMMAFGRYTFTH